MSKLQSYKGDVTIPVYGTIADAQIYLKVDADKVIAELKDRLRRQKYKRCLAQAQRCMDAHIETEADAVFFARWKHRWLTLAEKFKEAK